MNPWLWIKSFWSLLLLAVGQLFLWLNRKDEQKAHEEANERVSEVMSAAARPNAQNAARLNRWLARGRSGRLRNPRR